jgi:hypothetical protein
MTPVGTTITLSPHIFISFIPYLFISKLPSKHKAVCPGCLSKTKQLQARYPLYHLSPILSLYFTSLTILHYFLNDQSNASSYFPTSSSSTPSSSFGLCVEGLATGEEALYVDVSPHGRRMCTHTDRQRSNTDTLIPQQGLCSLSDV